MAAPRIYYSRLSDYTFTASAGSASGFGTDNLKTWYEDDLWKSASSANGQSLVIDFGSARARDSFVIANTNLFSMSSVSLQADDNSGFSSPTTVLTLVSASPVALDGTRQIFEFSAVTERYWRILFTTTAGLTPEIGQIFIDQKLSFQTAYDWPYRKGNALFETSESVHLDGRLRTSQPFQGRLVNEFRFTLQDEATRTAFLTFQQTVRGKLYYWYFLDADGSSIYYVNADADKIDVETTRYQQNAIQQLAMKEQRATRS